jgi:hypothetical protein
MSGRKVDEKKFSHAIVLTSNSNWRCGKLERSIIIYLRKRNLLFKKDTSIKELVNTLTMSHYSKDECLDAIKRLEKRKIVMLLSTNKAIM